MDYGTSTPVKGEKHPLWKGENITYGALHVWVKKEKGKPKYCEYDTTHTGKRFEWANISGKYLRDINDYRSLCVSCHRKMDYTPQKRQKVSNFMKGNGLHNKAIVQISLDGVTKVYFKSAKEAERITGISHKAISNCLGKYSKTSGGFKWNYHTAKLSSISLTTMVNLDHLN